jgi:putative Ca2+/H+ antiporter (TMEM165/GDT1 family)
LLLIFFSEIGDKTFFIALLLALKQVRNEALCTPGYQLLTFLEAAYPFQSAVLLQCLCGFAACMGVHENAEHIMRAVRYILWCIAAVRWNDA